MLGLKAVKLKDEISVVQETLVRGAAVATAATEQPLIPPAASFDVGHCDQGLWAHKLSTPSLGNGRNVRFPPMLRSGLRQLSTHSCHWRIAGHWSTYAGE